MIIAALKQEDSQQGERGGGRAQKGKRENGAVDDVRSPALYWQEEWKKAGIEGREREREKQYKEK
jgi:hypothetical protein